MHPCSLRRFSPAPRRWPSPLNVSAHFGRDTPENKCFDEREPCRTFQRPYDMAYEGGTVKALDAGEYGTIHISKPITIDGNGVGASISVYLCRPHRRDTWRPRRRDCHKRGPCRDSKPRNLAPLRAPWQHARALCRDLRDGKLHDDRKRIDHWSGILGRLRGYGHRRDSQRHGDRCSHWNSGYQRNCQHSRLRGPVCQLRGFRAGRFSPGAGPDRKFQPDLQPYGTPGRRRAVRGNRPDFG